MLYRLAPQPSKTIILFIQQRSISCKGVHKYKPRPNTNSNGHYQSKAWGASGSVPHRQATVALAGGNFSMLSIWFLFYKYLLPREY